MPSGKVTVGAHAVAVVAETEPTLWLLALRMSTEYFEACARPTAVRAPT